MSCPFKRCNEQVTHCDGACHGLTPDGSPIVQLPPLPVPQLLVECAQSFVYGFTGAQLQDYALAVVAAERERLEHERDNDFNVMQQALDSLEKVVDLAMFWIGREDTRGMSEIEYRTSLALGYQSKALKAGYAAIASLRERLNP